VLIGARDLCGALDGACHSEAWPLCHTELVGFASDELAEEVCE
jgi:hypothetical protein